MFDCYLSPGPTLAGIDTLVSAACWLYAILGARFSPVLQSAAHCAAPLVRRVASSYDVVGQVWPGRVHQADRWLGRHHDVGWQDPHAA